MTKKHKKVYHYSISYYYSIVILLFNHNPESHTGNDYYLEEHLKNTAYVVFPDPVGPRIALTPVPINPLLRKTNKLLIKD